MEELEQLLINKIMGREILYRNSALLGSLAVLLNVLIFDQVEQLTGLSLFIELIIVPVTLIFAVFWVRKRIAIASIIFFLFGFTLDLILRYSHYANELNHPIANKIQATFSVVGLVLMIFAVFGSSEKGWLMKKMNKIELYTMVTVIVVPLSMFLLLLSCSSPSIKTSNEEAKNEEIICTNKSCVGTYVGPEFVDGSDVAHQFSNTMSQKVGDKLKELYSDHHYSKVDFTRIKMSTEGMGSGTVVYKLEIPFQKVLEKCNAYTSFDHVGGWNHSPELAAREKQLEKALLEGDRLYISDLKKTPEGLQEYWIQWKNKEVQAECEN
ncbi:MAG: hypothetical protein HWE22_17105 [Flavobacteriales bacterium]|nr:hypothetical protein [Flavobacteriales bacterium]